MERKPLILCGFFLLTVLFVCPSLVHPITVHDFRVNADTSYGIAQYYVDVVFDSLGNFVIAYTDRGFNHDFRKVFFQRYDSLANRLDDPVLVSDTAIHYNDEPVIVMHPSGNFNIVWTCARPDPVWNYDWDIYLRRYDNSGNPLGEAQQVDIDWPDTGWIADYSPEIAMDKDGNFVVVWSTQNVLYPGTTAWGQLFNSSGERIGNSFFISDPDACDYHISSLGDFPRVAYNSQGYFFVCWLGILQDPGPSMTWTMGRVYSPSGYPVTGVFLFYPPGSDWYYGNHADVASNSQNNFVTAFSVNDTPWTYPNNAVAVCTYDTLGNPITDVQIVNDIIDLGDIWWMARVAVDDSDGYVVLWSDSHDGRNLWAQRFNASDEPQGANYRINIPPNSLATPSGGGYNRHMWNLDIYKTTVGFAWADARNHETYNWDIYAKLLDLDAIGFYLLGDVLLDGVVNLGDVIYLINYLYRGGPRPLPEWTGDVTSDGVTNIGDVVYLINYLFRNGPPPF